MFPSRRIHAIMGSLALLCAWRAAAAADLAPDSLTDVIYLALANGSDRFAFSHSAVLARGIRTQINISGSPRPDRIGAYQWLKTGAVSGTLTYATSDTSSRMEMTFTTADRGTYVERLSNWEAPLTGEFSLAPLPRDTTPPLVNLSLRVTLAPGQPSIAGFVITGSASRRVLVRAIGPTLASFGVADPAAALSLTVFRGQAQIARNEGWGGDPELAAAFGSAGAFALPASSRDCALLLTLPPGDYTAQVSGDAAKEALVEVYLLER